MTREILLLGRVRNFFFDDSEGQREFVLDMREDLGKYFGNDISFDVYCNKGGRVCFVYFLDANKYYDDKAGSYTKDILQLITGEGINDFHLLHPIKDFHFPRGRISDHEFGEIWEQSNDELGGDKFYFEKITVCNTRMKVYIKLK